MLLYNMLKVGGVTASHPYRNSHIFSRGVICVPETRWPRSECKYLPYWLPGPLSTLVLSSLTSLYYLHIPLWWHPWKAALESQGWEQETYHKQEGYAHFEERDPTDIKTAKYTGIKKVVKETQRAPFRASWVPLRARLSPLTFTAISLFCFWCCSLYCYHWPFDKFISCYDNNSVYRDRWKTSRSTWPSRGKKLLLTHPSKNTRRWEKLSVLTSSY